MQKSNGSALFTFNIIGDKYVRIIFKAGINEFHIIIDKTTKKYSV